MRCRFSRKIKLKTVGFSNPHYLVVLAMTFPLSAFVFEVSFRAQRDEKTLKRNLPILKKC